jgi:hypothetical protein
MRQNRRAVADLWQEYECGLSAANTLALMVLYADACVCRKLDSAMVVMKAAENRARCDGTNALNRPMDKGIMIQSSMTS